MDDARCVGEKSVLRRRTSLQKILDLVVHHEHDGATGTTEDVGESALEEGGTSFRLEDGGPAVSGVLVLDLGLGTARLHHHTPTDCVEGIGDDTGDGGHGLWEKERNGNTFWKSMYIKSGLENMMSEFKCMWRIK